MSGCREQRFENMLFAYELGLLSDEERKELELHVLECESCLEELKYFREAALHLKHDKETKTVIRNIDSQLSDDQPVILRHKKSWRTFIPIAAAAAVLLLLVLQPWQIEIHPNREAVAAENRLAITSFENLADSEDSLKLGEIAANLLITDLSESQYLQVVTRQQLFDILRQLNKDITDLKDNDLCLEIAKKAGARWVLTGSILQLRPEIILTSNLIDVTTGNIITSLKVSGGADTTLFPVIDKLTASIKADLPIGLDVSSDSDRKIADLTSYSTDAYRYYLDGLEYYRKRYFSEARRSFEQVLEKDSTFAMAYYYLAVLKDPGLLDMALKYIHNAADIDQYYIKSLLAERDHDRAARDSILIRLLQHYPLEKRAFRLLGSSCYYRGKYEEAIAYFEKALALDPNYDEIYNMLSFAYSKMGNLKKAIEANDKYISIVPDEPNPYDSRGKIYGLHGQLDSSIASYRKALEIKPDYPSALENLGVMYVLHEEYDKATEFFHKMASAENKVLRSQGRYYLALIPLYQGRMKRALEVISDCMAADRLEGAESEQGYKHIIKAIIYEGIHRTDSAFNEIEKSLGYDKNGLHLYYWLMARNGNIQKANRELNQLKDTISDSSNLLYQYYLAKGEVDMAGGDIGEAIKSLEKAESISPILPVDYMLGQAYLKAGYFEKAIEIFEKRTSIYESYSVCRGTWSVKMHYFLGLAYEADGRLNDAKAQYERFLNIWENADTGIAEIEDARIRLNRLNNRS